jgi:RNase P/RNase MRP subunit p30
MEKSSKEPLFPTKMNIIHSNNLENTRKKIRTSKESPIIVQAQDDNFNRKILEFGKFHILLSPEAGNRKHGIRQLDSGLNHVLAKIAFKNNVSIGINLEEISKLSKIEKARRISRINQNIKICRKAKTNLAIITNNKKNAENLLLSLGASTQQTAQVYFF